MILSFQWLPAQRNILRPSRAVVLKMIYPWVPETSCGEPPKPSRDASKRGPRRPTRARLDGDDWAATSPYDQVLAVVEEALDVVHTQIRYAWERGWQPRDIVDHRPDGRLGPGLGRGRRRHGRQPRRVRRVRPATVDEHFRDQLADLGAQAGRWPRTDLVAALVEPPGRPTPSPTCCAWRPGCAGCRRSRCCARRPGRPSRDVRPVPGTPDCWSGCAACWPRPSRPRTRRRPRR